jgi:hypothetical protein
MITSLEPDELELTIARVCSLKPCPLCGGSGLLASEINEISQLYIATVICSKCCSIKVFCCARKRKADQYGVFAKWNQRYTILTK